MPHLVQNQVFQRTRQQHQHRNNKSEQSQTTTKTVTVQPPGYTRKISREKNPQWKEKHKIMVRIREMSKLNNLVCMEIQREGKVPI